MRRATAAAIAALALAAVTSCGDNTAPPRPEVVVAQTAIQQEGVVGEVVPVAPAVLVTSSGGQPVGGVDVTFSVSGGAGTLATTIQKTNQSGVAIAAGWTLGTVSGSNTLTASVAGIATTITFTAQAQPATPASLTAISVVNADAQSGTTLPAQILEVRDRFNNVATNATVFVTATLSTLTGAGQLTGQTTVQTFAGRATFNSIAITGAGTFQLSFATTGIDPLVSSAFQIIPGVECGPSTVGLQFDFALGQTVRYNMNAANAPTCLYYNQARNQGQHYLLMFENMPLTGGSTSGIFSGSFTDASFPLRVRAGTASGAVSPRVAATPVELAPKDAVHAWDFGAGTIYEIQPEPPPAGTMLAPRVMRGGQSVDLNSLGVDYVVGDTIPNIRMEGIPRLGIVTSNNQKAVVRYISNELIIAEDVRLTTTLTRQSGAFNTPLTQTQLAEIAQEYAAQARVQADAFFQGRYNAETEATNGGRIIAVHSLMPSDNVWGYTYSTTNYFVWDFWVGTNGSVAGLNQVTQRVADNLFMHEIAHTRHAGLVQRAGLSWLTNADRGNLWLTEGFARFTERLPIAARLLNTAVPSRIDNVRLPFNTAAFGNSFFRDDVPTYLSAGSPMFDGYANSSFVFDYFADQISLQGGDWQAALREFLLAAGRQQTLDPVVSRWLPGLSFAELFTRARIALYTDDIGWPLPAWTQYHQYQLRLSRPPGSAAAADPRSAWPRLTPGSIFDSSGAIASGAAFGYVLRDTLGAANATIIVEAPKTANAVMSITRIR